MNIVVGVSGGIAAFKAVGVVRALVLAGHEVHVIPTESALKFVGLATWEAISRHPVTTDLFDGVAEVRHVALGQAADLVVVAPATADRIAKLASGIADDLLGTTILASRAPLVIAPAMHTEMWENAATVANIATLRSRGVTIVGPGVGALTGRDSGVGRMSEPDDIVRAALDLVGERDLAGRRILVTAGGTREPLDPVRFLGNRSSGRQGIALATRAAARGAHVDLVLANVDDALVPHHPQISCTSVITAAELAEAVHEASPRADVVVMAAAVADFRPEVVAEKKLKKSAIGDELVLRLVRTPDILASLIAARRPGQRIIGFAAETETDREELLRVGRAKRATKGADALVLNTVGWNATFGQPDNSVIVIGSDGEILVEAAGSKESVAERILDVIVDQDPR